MFCPISYYVLVLCPFVKLFLRGLFEICLKILLLWGYYKIWFLKKVFRFMSCKL